MLIEITTKNTSDKLLDLLNNLTEQGYQWRVSPDLKYPDNENNNENGKTTAKIGKCDTRGVICR